MGRGVQFLELQRLLEELLEHGIIINPEGLQRVVAQVTAQRAGAAPDRRRRRVRGSLGRTGLAAPRTRGHHFRLF